MEKRYDNKSSYPEDWSTPYLKTSYRGHYDSIYNVGCYGSRDIRNLELIAKELHKRGWSIREQSAVHFIPIFEQF